MRTPVITAVVAAALVSLAGVAHGADAAPQRTPAPTLKVRTSQFGPILFSGTSRALYAFLADRRGGPSRCYGACAAAWPPYIVRSRAALRGAAGIKRSLLGTVRRRDGRLQVTYAGWPLYFYAHEGPGVVKCQNVHSFGALWLVQRASGRLVR